MDTRLEIIHETLYQYTKPTSFGPHRLVLRPRESHDLQVESMTLDISPAFEIEWSRDVFGNSVAVVEFLASGTELCITNHVKTRQQDPHRPVAKASLRVPYPVIYDELELGIAAAYQAPVYPEEAVPVQSWAKRVANRLETDDALTKVTFMNEAIYREIRYKRRETKGVQSPGETLTEGSGSCRDMATLLMEACRSLQIAARFSSGYLDCPTARAGAASTHAWVEVYLPQCGWMGFDPTSGARTSDKHISVGVSNHPRGVMPVSGRFYGNSFDYIGMKVSVSVNPSLTS